MRRIREHKGIIGILLVLFVGVLVWTLRAGDLNPPGAPTGTMRTLNEIYAAAFEPVSVPSASTLAPSSDVYLYISNIPGSCTATNHRDWIDVMGYTFHVENGAAPKEIAFPKFSNLLIAKYTDEASVPLMMKACDNTCLDQVIIERTRATPDKPAFYRLTLTNARVTYIAPVSAATPGAEVIAIGSFDHIKWEYLPYDEPNEWQIEEWDIGKDGGES